MPAIRGSEALMQIFRAEGVEFIFGLPGSTETQFMDSLEDHPEIRYILGLHECIAAGMAVGYARASCKAGVLNLHTFVGLGGAMATLLDAYRGGIPLIVTAGQGDATTAIRETGLSADLISLGKAFSRWSGEVNHGSNLALTMRRAFKVANQSPPGPVFVSLPQNVMNENLEFEYTPNPPSAFNRRLPDRESLERAAALITRAQKPVVQLGPAVARSQAIPEVIELVELIGAPVFVPGMRSDTLFPTTHRQYRGALGIGSPEIRRLSGASDLTIAIGAQPSILTANIVQIDNDPWELGKNTPVTAAIDGDVKLSLAGLNEFLKKKMTTEDKKAAKVRADNIACEKEQSRENWLAQAEKVRDEIPMRDSRLGQELANILPPDTVIVDESWSHSTDILESFDFSESDTYFRHRGVSIGQGLPIAIGVKLAMPGRPVVALVGDGSAAWSCQSLWTAAHYNIPVKFVIVHDASYRLVKMNKMRQLGEQVKDKSLGLDLNTPVIDFPRMAESMGVRGQRANQPEDVKKALKSALESDKPELIEVPVEGKI